MARNANATVPRCWYTLVRNRPTPGTPIAKSASLCSANSFTCRGVMICSASDFSSSGFMGFESSGTSSPFKRIVAGRPTLRSRSDALRSEEHTSELQSLAYLVCRLLLEKKNPVEPDLNAFAILLDSRPGYLQGAGGP